MSYRIAVVGDAMIDLHRMGTSCRQSLEAPDCTILEETSRAWSLGGAANVAAWLAAAGNLVTLYSTHAYDEAGLKLRELCHDRRIRLENLLQHGEPPVARTTLKERICLIGEDRRTVRQLARVDQDTDTLLGERDFRTISKRLEQEHYDAIVVADYDKGMFRGKWGEVLRREIGAFRTLLVVNSKVPINWAPVDTNFLVCNKAEMEASWPGYNAVRALYSVHADFLVVTAGIKGVSVCSQENRENLRSFWQPTRATNIVDVTGAGDAFTAGITHGILRQEWKHEEEITTAGLDACAAVGQEWAAICCGQIGVGVPDTL